MKNFVYMILGIAFGIVLVQSEVMSWFRIRNMFLFKEAHMYLIISSAIVVAMMSVWILKALKVKSLSGDVLSFKGKPWNKGIVFGGLIFGVGWAITGACPGPVFAQIGTGAYPAIFTLVGAVLGAYLYALLRGKLPH